MSKRHFPGLTVKQEKALFSIAGGASITAAASVSGVTRQTVTAWMRLDKFREALRTIRQEISDEAFGRGVLELSEAFVDAVRQLRKVARNKDVPGAVRVKAATELLAARLNLQADEEAARLRDALEKLGAQVD